ncbi:MAG: GspE/PulE family protein [Planctomycetota bacterium]|jgi:type II secretory ATPase GspE/PulE/Tfp pilus assembly ATPase PilB-like protein
MPDLLLSFVEYAGYISIVKFIIFLVLFFLWLLLVSWVYHDAQAIDTRADVWTGIVFGTGAVAAIIWLVVPLFIVGVLFYLIAVGAASIAYVTHRNARVMDYDRILTTEHIKSLFVSEDKKLAALKSFVFITANKNEVPVPQGRTPDFYGYKVAHELFTDATWRRASDVVFSPTPQEYRVAYYVDGAAVKQPSIVRDQAEYFIRFIKNLADLDASEKRKPQKGKFKIRQGGDNIEWEVTTAGSTAGEQVILKQATQKEVTKLADIGLMPEQLEELNRIGDVKQGLFIISGPKKSGVTTTFYALLRRHDAFINSINTLERQLSAELPNITQNVFALSDSGTTTYGRKLQTMVRMGPDIVGVAGCQDAESARVACEAAKDGKIVYVTLEEDSVVKALGKWIKLVGDKTLAAKSLIAISNQRLLRRLCEECKQAYAPNKELLRKFSMPAEKAKVLYRAGKVQYDKRGKAVMCENCQGTGFVGRTGIFEMVTIDDQLRKAVEQSESLSEIGSRFRGAKMLYLQEQVLRKVISGTTAINEMVRVLSKARRRKAPKTETKE